LRRPVETTIISGRTFDCMKQLRPPAGAGGRYLPADGGDVQSAETGRSEMTMKIAGRAIAYRKLPSRSCYSAPMICFLVPVASVLRDRHVVIVEAMVAMAAVEDVCLGGDEQMFDAQ